MVTGLQLFTIVWASTRELEGFFKASIFPDFKATWAIVGASGLTGLNQGWVWGCN